MAKNTIKIDFANNRIIIDKTFAKKASDVRSEEYALLQQVRNDYPAYIVVVREIKKWFLNTFPEVKEFQLKQKEMINNGTSKKKHENAA